MKIEVIEVIALGVESLQPPIKSYLPKKKGQIYRMMKAIIGFQDSTFERGNSLHLVSVTESKMVIYE
jgi:hypothetical protein